MDDGRRGGIEYSKDLTIIKQSKWSGVLSGHYYFVPLQTVRWGIRDKVNKKYVFDFGINCIKRSTNEHTQALGFHEDGRKG